MIDVLKAQLLALRAQVDAMLAVIDTVYVSPAPPEPASCLHPETENIGTFGAPEYRCMACRASVAAPT
jgi:hypothetical protein